MDRNLALELVRVTEAAAEVALKEAISTISKATSKGVYHKNNCARKVSRLSKAVNSIG